MTERGKPPMPVFGDALPAIGPGSRRGTGYVYVLLAEVNVARPLVKIGFSARSPLTRLSACQTGSPVALQIVAVVLGSRTDESDLHRRFREHRSHGEWFFYEGDVRAWVEGLRA